MTKDRYRTRMKMLGLLTSRRRLLPKKTSNCRRHLTSSRIGKARIEVFSGFIACFGTRFFFARQEVSGLCRAAMLQLSSLVLHERSLGRTADHCTVSPENCPPVRSCVACPALGADRFLLGADLRLLDRPSPNRTIGTLPSHLQH